ncbi:hypothetical protein K413DRAFT_3032 [Clostridium sp. ASBs410]|nr:hypothetical protein K413DRAFT_3032 [Clostridium sp. ASBs410]
MIKIEQIDLINDKKIVSMPYLCIANGFPSAHEVDLCYSNSGGDYYYMFWHLNGKYVTNFGKDEFDVLNNKIPIKGYSIFLGFKDNQEIHWVPDEFR